MADQLGFDDVVIVRHTPETRRRGVAGLRGVVAGISRADDTDEIAAYAVWLDDRQEVWMFDPSEIEPTGEVEPRELRMSDLSIRVSEQGELLEGPFPTDR